MSQLVPLRQFKGWAIRPFYLRRHERTWTHIDVDEELWLALRRPAEVRSAGADLFRVHNPSTSTLPERTVTSLWREFRAYLRQAEGFYRGAKVLPWKSSPLNYYYSFLNISKACCLLQGLLPVHQAAEPRVIHHGLSARVIAGNPDIWQLTVGGADSVFPMLYRAYIGMTINPNTLLNARDLLGYSRQIGWQLKESGYFALIRSYPCRWAILARDAEYWDVIAIPTSTQFGPLWNSLGAIYEEVEPLSAKDFAFRIFEMHGVVASTYRFFQRRRPEVSDPPNEHRHEILQVSLQQALPNAIFEYTEDTSYEFLLDVPYMTGGLSLPMNEAIASYAIMFFLSSLVRYHPEYMDSIAESSDAWIIESFAKSAPLAMLRYMTANVLGYTLIIQRK